MNDDQLRIACAVALGWTGIVRSDLGTGYALRGDLPKLQSEKVRARGEENYTPDDLRGWIPNPLTSYDDAFALVQHAREEGYIFRVLSDPKRFKVCFDKATGPLYDATDPDLRRAICLAFLKLKGRHE